MIAALVRNVVRRLRRGPYSRRSRQVGTAETLQAAATQTPPAIYRGNIIEISDRHVDGWVQKIAEPAERVDYEIVLKGDDIVLARGRADQFRHGLHAGGAGDGAHAFLSRLPRLLDKTEQDRIVVRPVGCKEELARSPDLRTTFQPILHVAMDIVDNCNLRCPFCLYDYAGTNRTNFIDDETIDSVFRFLPYTRDGEFWLSCLHEPTLHPMFAQFIARVPAEYRRKLCYTTNLAKRMPPSYYTMLADAGLHHINVSIESLQPALYERMRKGARHHIFMAGWDALLAAVQQGSAPPPLNYISMVYKSNLGELPEMVSYLLEERRASSVQLRYTFDVPHLPPKFRASEFLDPDEWLELQDRLAHFPRDRVQLILPPPPTPPATAARPNGPVSGSGSLPVIPDYYMFRMSWDGRLRVVGTLRESRNDSGIEADIVSTNVRDISDPAAFLDGLAGAMSASYARGLTA